MDRQAAQALIENTFNYPFDEDRFRSFVINLLNDVDEGKAFSYLHGQYIKDSFKQHVKKYKRIGTYTDPDGSKVDVLVVHLVNPWALERSRTMLRNFAAWYLKNRDEKDAALIGYHTDVPDDWRFSLVKMEYHQEVAETGRIKVKEELTPARRYSYLVGKNEPNHTAQTQLIPILEDDRKNPRVTDIEDAFSVDAVTKQFYTDYRYLFEELADKLNRILKKDKKIRTEFEDKSIDPANFAKKLMGQIVFLYFLQKKGWLGVEKDEQGNFRPWGTGPKNFLRRLFNKEYTPYKNFFNDVLEPLFYSALNNGDRPNDYYDRLDRKIPFLDGGLFEPMNDYNWWETDIKIKNETFAEIFDTFDRYNFTVREDEPLEKEVAVDPEMLGKVFENLLPENLRKGKGSYYTPRTIVHYMCQESLINYLDTAVNSGEVSLAATPVIQRKLFRGLDPEQMSLKTAGYKTIIPRNDIEDFIRKGEFAVEHDIAKEKGAKSYKYQIPESIRKNARLLDAKLNTIKICDPAIGSGAFPVGMMNEIVKARLVLDTYLKTGKSSYDFKRHCIQESLYGVDIDPGAIDIAKLRLWLSLVVDEEDYHTIQPLPNLDFKIMQGNSLIEEFHGISLDLEKRKGGDYTLFEEDKELDQLIQDLHRKQTVFFNATHHSEKEEAKQDVEEALLAVFRHELEKQRGDYFRELKRIEGIAKTLKSNIRDQYLKEEKAKLSKRFNDFDFEAIENELLEMTHGNKPRRFFPWKLYFADVFREKGGFDVVLANPPYVDSEFMVKHFPNERNYISDNYLTAKGNWDLYIPFLEKSNDIAKENGFYTFITPNKWFSINYGKSLREFVRDKLYQICDCNDVNVFEAGNSPVVSFFEISRRSKKIKIDCYDSTFNLSFRTNVNDAILNSTNWGVLFSKNLNIVLKLKDSVYKISDYFTVENPFTVSEAYDLKKMLRDLKPVDKKRIYLKFVNTGTIDPYLPLWGIKRTTYLKSKYDKPVVYENTFRSKMPKRFKQVKSPKIIITGMRYFECFLDLKGEYIAGKSTLIVKEKRKSISLETILAILNSKLITFYINQSYSSLGIDGGTNFSVEMVNSLPLPKNLENQNSLFESLSKQIIALKNKSPEANISALKAKIDRMVYELYDLTEEEIAIVKESVG